MATPETYDAIVIGTGQGGKPLAVDLARAGRKTAVIEAGHVGGTCINVGCTPTKTMVASGRAAYLARRAADYGVRVTAPEVDLAVVRKRKDAIVTSFRTGSQRRLESTDGVDLIFGEARFEGARAIAVDVRDGPTRHLQAETIFINTGGRPATPRIEGIDRVPLLDSSSIMELETLPEHLLVLGGGYVGLEFGQMFRRFASEVTIVQRGPQLLAREDPDVAESVAGILTEDGIDVLLSTKAVAVEPGSDGTIRLKVRDERGERTLTGSHLLVSAGRTPNTHRLNLDAAGVETNERGFVVVNERLETSAAGIYALGDVNGGPAYTHIAYDDYRIIRANLLHGGHATTAGRLVPYTVFMDPQLGRVGLSETEARAQGRPLRIAKLPMTHVARAIEVDETRGFMKAVVDAETDLILGCAVLGIEGGEVMSVVQVAMMGGLPYTALRDGVFAHPTLAESLNNLFMAMEA